MNLYRTIRKTKYRLLAGTLFIFFSCTNVSSDNKNDMTTKTDTAKFILPGKWKLKSVTDENKYPLPEFIIFRSDNIYSIEGKETDMHPVLDGGWYNYDNGTKELKINSANDAILKFKLKEKKDVFVIVENEKQIAEYKKAE